MPLKWEILHDQKLVHIIAKGRVTLPEMEEHFDKKQIETLKDKSLGNALQYAEMIRQNHSSRVRRQ